MPKRDRDRETPLFRVWARDVEDEDASAQYGAFDARTAAEIHARYGWSGREYYDCSWPMVFTVVDPDGKTYAVEVTMEMCPEFRASSPEALADLAPAIHVTENDNGIPMCGDIRLPPGHSGNWPEGQHAIPYAKVTDEKLASGACEKCVKRYRSRRKFLADVAERREQITKERQS